MYNSFILLENISSKYTLKLEVWVWMLHIQLGYNIIQDQSY